MRDEFNDNSVSLKTLILRIKDYYYETLKNWPILLIIVIVSVSFMLYHYSKKDTTHVAKLEFVIEGDKGSGGGISSVLGSFGINQTQKINQYKVIEIAKSPFVMLPVLSEKLNKKNLGDVLIGLYKDKEGWTSSGIIDDSYKFDTTNIFNNSKDGRIFKALLSKIWESSNQKLANLEQDPGSHIYSLTTESIDPDLSIVLTNKIYQHTKDFFENEVYENILISKNALEKKADSLRQLQFAKSYELAKYEDENKNLIFKQDNVRRATLMSEIRMLNGTYTEVYKNYEMTKFNLDNLRPIFIIIDKPFKPLSVNKPSFFKSVIYGVILGLIFGLIFISIRKLYRDIMNS